MYLSVLLCWANSLLWERVPSSRAAPAGNCLFHLSLQVLDLISSDSLNVPSEEEVYRAVLSWVKHDVDSRRQHVPRVSLLGKVTCFNPPAPISDVGG